MHGEKLMLVILNIITWSLRIFAICAILFVIIKIMFSNQYYLLIFPIILAFILFNNIKIKNRILKLAYRLLEIVLFIICALVVGGLIKMN